MRLIFFGGILLGSLIAQAAVYAYWRRIRREAAELHTKLDRTYNPLPFEASSYLERIEQEFLSIREGTNPAGGLDDHTLARPG